ncbi:MarR family winged helix-turn-helix transcriptional regulator [Actinomadura sp. ATCC 31491]|uniref:MarR family winged helix-turn-helix transcriptional regulator n=1 Tax=Actinomadura luzonensis TaxID=2805427 RepID=A0ABT0G8S4_9ACTN|nr:MarR family winged helix-turn-helix transcriptional regulator [Actinomadura luzonensis]MCK2220982.1 MarR family winged helix-turn-helix transcriptional regulator [Actinomadura luzonensis]
MSSVEEEKGGERDFGWSLGVLLRAFHGSLSRVLDDLPHGPRGYQTLSTVVHGDQPSQLALAAHLGIDRTVMTYLIDDLVEAGLVERRLNPADRRQRKIVATERGVAVLADLERRVREVEDHVLRPLTPDEREAFRGMLRRVACGVADVHADTDPCEVVDEVLGDGRR